MFVMMSGFCYTFYLFNLMEFVLTIEDEFGIEISDEEIDQLQSVADVIKAIKEKI